MQPRLIVALALSTLSLAGSSHAVTLLNTGFESPDYMLGDLVGQNGWDAVGFFDDDVVSVNVQNAVVKSGAQAVSLTGSGQGAGAFAYNATPFTPMNGQKIVIDVDMNWGTAGGTRSFLYGLQTYDPDLNSIGSVGIAQIAGIYNAVVFDGDGTPIAIPGAAVTPGEWYHFQLTLDFASQTYQASMDNFVSAVMPFQTSDILQFGETDLFRDAGPLNANDTAYFDNLSAVVTVIPEPTSLGLLGGAALVALRRRA